MATFTFNVESDGNVTQTGGTGNAIVGDQIVLTGDYNGHVNAKNDGKNKCHQLLGKDHDHMKTGDTYTIKDDPTELVTYSIISGVTNASNGTLNVGSG